jgi:hypothetical protein
VNVRDTSISSNEGTGIFNNINQLSKNDGGGVHGSGGSPPKNERINAGFNISYDSNTF